MKKYQILSCLLVLHGYIMHAAQEGKEAVVLSLQDQIVLDNELFDAVQNQNIEKIMQLLAQGANVNARTMIGWTMLMEAVSIGNVPIIQLLLTAGANVHARTRNGHNVLMQAVLQDETGILPILLAAEAGINDTNAYGETALMLAAGDGNVPVVQLLINAGADINLVSQEGNTALMDAAFIGAFEVVHILLQAEADVKICNHEGFSALMLSIQGLQDQYIPGDRSVQDKYLPTIEILLDAMPWIDKPSILNVVKQALLLDDEACSRSLDGLIELIISLNQLGIGLK